MNLACPNDPTHQEFTVTAAVLQEWKVGPKGNVLNVTEACKDGDIVEGIAHCAVCGAKATES